MDLVSDDGPTLTMTKRDVFETRLNQLYRNLAKLFTSHDEHPASGGGLRLMTAQMTRSDICKIDCRCGTLNKQIGRLLDRAFSPSDVEALIRDHPELLDHQLDTDDVAPRTPRDAVVIAARQIAEDRLFPNGAHVPSAPGSMQ